MVTLSKIHCSYEIKDPKDELKPNDEIEGKFFIESKDKKDKKLKKALIKIVEIYSEKIITHREGEEIKTWKDRQKDLKKFEIVKGETLKSGEKKEYDFQIKMPGTWTNKKKNKIKDWHLALFFIQKTGMVASRGADKDAAYCVLPVEGTSRTPSFGNQELKKKKKEKKDKDKKDKDKKDKDKKDKKKK